MSRGGSGRPAPSLAPFFLSDAGLGVDVSEEDVADVEATSEDGGGGGGETIEAGLK